MNKTKKIVAVAVSTIMAGTMIGTLSACKPKDKELRIVTSIGYSTTDTTGISFSTKTLPLVNADGSEAQTSIKLPDGTEYRKGALKPVWKSLEQALDVRISDNWTRADDNLEQCATEGLEKYQIIGAGNTNTIQTQVNGNALLDFSQHLDKMPNLKNFLENNALAKLGTLASGGAMYYTPYYAGMNDAERYNLFRKDYVSELLDVEITDAKIAQYGGTITFKSQADAKKTAKYGNRKEQETYNGAASSIKSYMGQTDSYVVKTTDPSDILKTVYVKVNYGKALTAAKDGNTPLGKAIADAAGTAYTGASGNIVDLQNFVIDAKAGEVKGEHLLKILREYVKVAYEWSSSENGTYAQFYGTKVNGVDTKLSDLFNSTYAAWDVDTYAAIGRVFVTCGNMLGKYQAQASDYTVTTKESYTVTEKDKDGKDVEVIKYKEVTASPTNKGAATWLFVPRTGYTNRTTRLTALIGELYGVRGMETMEYLDSSGNLRQTRFNASTWDALTQFSAFHTEGLVPSFNTTDTGTEIGSIGSNSACSLYDGVYSHFQGLSSNDFIHTQTTISGNEYAQKVSGDKGYVETADGYKWTGVVTPVSRWLTTDKSTRSNEGAITVETDGLLKDRPANKTTVMRFTESALKLKTGGIVVPKANESKPELLDATLKVIDYLYSNDGRILTTFGDISTDDNISGNATDGYTTTNDGWWYGKPATKVGDVSVEGKTMEELKTLGVVETHDNVQYNVTEKYQGYALCYKNKLYITGTKGDDYNVDKGGYVYNGVMTPFFTRAVRALALEKAAVNGYKSTTVYSSTNLQNLCLGQEGFGVQDNAAMVQLCNEQAIEGFDTFGAALGNGATLTVKQAITENPWYTCTPSVTLSTNDSNIIKGYGDFTKLFTTSSKITNYFILEMGWYGANAGLGDFKEVGDKTLVTPTTPAGVVTYIKKLAPQYEMLRNNAWQDVYADYNK